MAIANQVNQKVIFEKLEPWLKILNFFPTQEPFPIHKCLYLILGLFFYCIPSIWFLLTTKDFGTFCSALTECIAFTVYFAQTFWLGVQMKKYGMLMQDFGNAWKTCKSQMSNLANIRDLQS